MKAHRIEASNTLPWCFCSLCANMTCLDSMAVELHGLFVTNNFAQS